MDRWVGKTCSEKECRRLHRCAAFTTSLNFKKASYAAVASEGLTMLNMLLGTEGPVILLKALKTSMTWLLGTDAITLPERRVHSLVISRRCHEVGVHAAEGVVVGHRRLLQQLAVHGRTPERVPCRWPSWPGSARRQGGA